MPTGVTIAMIVAKPVVAANIGGTLASQHAVADREGVMKL